MRAFSDKNRLADKRAKHSDVAKNKNFEVSKKFTFNIQKVTKQEILETRSSVYPFWI